MPRDVAVSVYREGRPIVFLSTALNVVMTWITRFVPKASHLFSKFDDGEGLAMGMPLSGRWSSKRNLSLSAAGCHCIVCGKSAPPRFSGTM